MLVVAVLEMEAGSDDGVSNDEGVGVRVAGGGGGHLGQMMR